MKISYNWLQSYFDESLPKPEELSDILTTHSFEVEHINSVKDDYILDIDILPNRAHDCLSHRGIAKEISILLNRKLKNDPFLTKDVNLHESNELTVSIQDEKLCKRYSACVIKNIHIKDSPDWLKKRLESIGQKSINNIVDIVNMVMFDMGQPLHAFNLDSMEVAKGKYKIVVRSAHDGELIQGLNEEEYSLISNNLLIVDGNTDIPIGIAGVKGSSNTGITLNTKNIIIESANFNPTNIRKTAQQLQLRTDASTRFEHEISANLTLLGIHKATQLITQIASSKETIIEGYVDIYPKIKSPYVTGVSQNEINQVLGTHMSEKEVENILERLDFNYQKIKPQKEIVHNALKFVGVPYKYGASVSFDAPNYFDCSSLTSFLFAHVGVSIPRMSIDQYFFGDEVEEINIQPGDIVFSRGKTDTLHYKSVEFMPDQELKEGISHCGIYLGDGKIIHATKRTENVIIEHLIKSESFKNIIGVRRMTDKSPRFVITVPFERLDLRIKEDLIEEIGRLYGYRNIETQLPEYQAKDPKVNKKIYYINNIRNILVRGGFSEVYTYALNSEGAIALENPLTEGKEFLREKLAEGDIFRLSMSINIKNKPLLGLEEIKVFEIGTVFNSKGEYTHLLIVSETKITTDNIIDKICKDINYGLENAEIETSSIIPTYIVESSIQSDSPMKPREFNLNTIIDRLLQPDSYEIFDQPKTIKYQLISPYPFVLRDIAIWTPKDITSAEISKLITKEAGNLLVKLKLFDIYQKGDKQSYAFRLVFQSHKKTLSDDEVNVIMEKITKFLNSYNGWEVR